MIENVLIFIFTAAGAWLALRFVAFAIKYSEQAAKGSRPKLLAWNRYCPRCEQTVKRFDRVFSVKELLFGGWTCPQCGTEFDQVNEVRIARSIDAHLRDPVSRSYGRMHLNYPPEKSRVDLIIEEDEE